MYVAVKQENNILTAELLSHEISEEHVQNIEASARGRHAFDLMVCDCREARTISDGAVKRLGDFAGELSQVHREFILLAGHEVLATLKGSRLEENARSVIEFNRLNVKPKNTNVPSVERAREVLLSATIQNMATYMGGLPRVKSKFTKDSFGTSKLASVELRGMIEMKSPSWKGSLVLSFQKDVFLNVISKIMGTQFFEVEPEIADWAAEFVNMIVGLAKQTMADEQSTFTADLPRMVTEAEAQKIQACPGLYEGYILTSPYGEFQLEVCTST